MLAILMFAMLAIPGSGSLIRPRQGNATTLPGDHAFNQSSGLEYATSCIESKLSWAVRGGSTYASDTVVITSVVWANTRDVATYHTTTSLSNSTAYMLCDGWPRINGTTSVVKHSSWRTDTSTSSYTTTMAVSTALPAPNCTIAKSDCDLMYSSWASAESSYNATVSAYESYVSSANSASLEVTVRRPYKDYISPICGSPTTIAPQWAVYPATCVVNDATVQLLYWPVTRDVKDLCNNNASTTTMGPTIPGKPNTAEYWNTTLTSPTVYIALDGTWQLKSSGATYRDHSQVLIPQEPTAVSSICGVTGGGPYVPYPVNYADFDGYPPASAYRCQPRCLTHSYVPRWVNATNVYSRFTLGDVTVPESTSTYLSDNYTRYATENLCSTIWDDYRPALSIPPEFSTMAPIQHGTFGSCGFMFDPGAIFYDPPKALIQRVSIVEPHLPMTTSAAVSTTARASPDPGSVPIPATPRETQISSSTKRSSAQPTILPGLPGGSSAPSRSSGAPQLSEQGDEQTIGPRPAKTGDPQITPSDPSAIGVMLTAANGQTLTAIQAFPSGPVLLSGATLRIGDSVSHDGMGQVLVQPEGLLVDGNVRTFSTLDRVTLPTIGAILSDHDGNKLVASRLSLSGPVIIGSLTLRPHQSTSVPAVGIVLLAANGLIVNGKPVAFSALNLVTTLQWVHSAGINSGLVLTLGGRTYAADQSSGFVLDQTTLTPGGVAVVDGTTLSLDASGRYVVVGGITQSFEIPPRTSLPSNAYSTAVTDHGLVDGLSTAVPGGSPVLSSSAIRSANALSLVCVVSALVYVGFLL